MAALVTVSNCISLIVRFAGVARNDGARLTSVTVTVNVFVALRFGEPLSVTRVVHVFVLGPCASLPSIDKLGTPVTVKVLDRSMLTFDFSAFKREAPVSGELRGYVPGKLVDDSDNQVILTGGSFDLGRTTLFTDNVCGGQPSDSIRTADPSRLKLDAGKQSTLTLGRNGTVSALTYMVLDLPLELRNGDDGCTKPYVTTGYSTASETVRLTGSVGTHRLAGVGLQTAPPAIALLGILPP